jgi:hypothetical protein
LGGLAGLARVEEIGAQAWFNAAVRIFGPPPEPILEGSPLEICDQLIRSAHAKARDNNRNSRVLTILVAAATATIPLFLVLSTQWFGFVLGKVVPALLAAVAAVLTALLSQLKPNERLRLYRKYELVFLTERLKYQQGIDHYTGTNKDAVFLKTLVSLRLKQQDEWAGLVPSSEQAAKDAHPN